jgi:outer membrane protein OmpA-like peptidoglycan-associated protein
MTFKTPLILSTLGILALTACVPADPYAQPYGAQPTNGQLGPRAQSGALIGAMAGGLLGSQSSDDRLLKTAVGAGIGAIVGGAIGTTLDQQAQELRGINGQFNVTNMGDYLVVNMPQDVLFGVDSASLRPDLTRDIKSVAQNLLRYPNSQIQIVGHTDNTGSASYTQDLSQRRAVSVANVLRESGVPNARISAFGRGEDQPIASNLTPEGRAQNRRVEIIIRPTV